MGWDAYSSAEYNYTEKRFEDPEVGKMFEEAFAIVKKIAGSVDGYLDHGGLDCSACAEMLEKASGQSCWTEKGWSVDDVKKINEYATWDFPYYSENAWAYWSARKFLEVCARAELSITFSW